jgi:hypothetical protein
MPEGAMAMEPAVMAEGAVAVAIIVPHRHNFRRWNRTVRASQMGAMRAGHKRCCLGGAGKGRHCKYCKGDGGKNVLIHNSLLCLCSARWFRAAVQSIGRLSVRLV